MSELTNYVIMPSSDYQEICDAVREKTGTTEVLKSGEVADAVRGITGVENCQIQLILPNGGDVYYTWYSVSNKSFSYGKTTWPAAATSNVPVSHTIVKNSYVCIEIPVASSISETENASLMASEILDGGFTQMRLYWISGECQIEVNY